MSWRIRGSYFESCNCDAICPCRRIDGVPGGPSTHGVCMGLLSWLIEEGAADGVDLSGLPVAVACRYSDDEPGSPWTWVLYLDSRADDEQRTALEGIFTGRLGGDAETHFPWAWKRSELVAVRPVEIDVDHTRRCQRLRIRDRVSVRIRDSSESTSSSEASTLSPWMMPSNASTPARVTCEETLIACATARACSSVRQPVRPPIKPSSSSTLNPGARSSAFTAATESTRQ